MAAVTSLGVHAPVALPYLVAEGLLPPDPSKDLYQWETYITESDDSEIEEEVLATKTVVVWSQGHFVRNVYRFDLEGENVSQALLTSFPTSSKPQVQGDRISGTQRTPRKRVKLSTGASEDHITRTPPALERALVVLLKTKAHIHFLRGASHIVNLPFEIDRAFSAPRGLLLQRKSPGDSSVHASPPVPAAPPNSFLSPQHRLSRQSYLQSPTFPRSFGSTKPAQPSPLGGDTRLESLFNSLTSASSKESDEDVANIYSLTGALSDLGVVTYSIQRHRPVKSGKQTTLNVEFEGLEPTEKVIYVTPKDELAAYASSDRDPLILIATINPSLNVVSIWHAWYLEQKSLNTLLKLRTEHKAAKARRRSSFLSASAATGTATPAVRRRDAPRESFGATLQPDALQGNPTSRKPTRQEEEENMAAQMDPDYRATSSQQPAREGNRRVSSMNADVRASQTTVGASFAGTAGRRHTSFGGQKAGRRSLSQRKSRGSTASNVFSQSLGTDDDSMDLDFTIEVDPEENFDAILQHIRNTYNISGVDTVFGSAEEGFKRDVVVRKLHSFSVGQQSFTRGSGSSDSFAGNYSVATLYDGPSINGTDDPKIRIYLHDRRSKEVQYSTLKVKFRPLYPNVPGCPAIPLPALMGESRMVACDDMAKLHDGNLQAILFGNRGVQFSLDEQSSCPLLFDAPFRAHSGLDFALPADQGNDIGKNRLLAPPPPPLLLQHVGCRGAFDIVGSDGIHHRRALRLRPFDLEIDQLITLCTLMLSKAHARIVRKTWCMAYAWISQNPSSLENTASSKEFVALVGTMFTFVLELLDDKAKAAVNLAKVATGKSSTGSTQSVSAGHRFNQRHLHTSSTWSWLSSSPHSSPSVSPRSRDNRKDQLLITAAVIADELASSVVGKTKHIDSVAQTAAKFMLGLYVFREERTLNTLTLGGNMTKQLAPVIAQLGSWLGIHEWGFTTAGGYSLVDAKEEDWAMIKPRVATVPQLGPLERPVSVYQWYETALKTKTPDHFPSLFSIARLGVDGINAKVSEATANALTPRLVALSDLLIASNGLTASPTTIVRLLAQKQFTIGALETLPESIAAPLMEAIVRCEREPPTTWRNEFLELVGRADLIVRDRSTATSPQRPALSSATGTRDVHSVCSAIDRPHAPAKTKEAGRHAITQLIFSDDRRMVEATSLMHFNTVQVGWCAKEDEWDEQKHFDMQRKVMHHVTTRMIALPAGDGMFHYDSQTPLLTEKYQLPGFSSSCLMQPMGHTLTADRSGLSEEKVNWAYFHAGVSIGIRISKSVKGIDTSWIAFNKPNELTNRHAGLLLALGLGGHLRHLAKWLSFKYLTPKHTMTSVGLLLGLSASYIGTMDALITKMLSVHITKMLPPGAADVNVSPATQTAGLMGIGLLYYDTQHRRMSEIMLSEIEYMEVEDPDCGPDPLRDESYRLAAGFALGLINLGKGNNLRGLHGMQLAERLLAMAVGPRPIHAVHVFDRATAGSVVALALVYMKSGENSVATKVDIPDTETQFDHVRPDILMLRAMAKHIILWDSIQVHADLDSTVYTFEKGWIGANLPRCYNDGRIQTIYQVHARKREHNSAHIPLYYILAGLAWALGLKYAGSGNVCARDELLSLLEWYDAMNTGAFVYDAKITRAALCRCQDVVAVAAAVVMAGTGDLDVYRFLRPMHARLDAQTPYGSHMAAHIAIGILFLAGGTYTFGTSDLAIAALMISLHPIWPVEVNDNRVHLQAFRHLWVLAAEARCIVIEDVDTRRPIHLPIKIVLKTGETKEMRAPCLLPELDSIATVQTADPAYWRVTLDFVSNPRHLDSFRKDQRVYVRRCPASEAHESVFSAALAALTDMNLSAKPSSSAAAGFHAGSENQSHWFDLLSLPAFRNVDHADKELILPAEVHSSVYTDERTTVVDERLVLANAVSSRKVEDLWNLRTLIAWAERRDAGMRWLGREVLQDLRAGIEQRGRGG
ncbi:hypothetical protein CERZMDRAFT_37892 [Cercospora zeae-maydis SCOH1-5]|uniref:Uncharacterized protein n=1 Tax=Cercospora zeae-maydis SCOH1-5 TaxID=717836 RepID=A0A6A6FM13_9PEZI|nr:hypothetical protein CERZMDRAFT_37892 [Cercospora zeae-maydis SCOH1-5]